jgi:CheY-like chemotaxis protein/HPt (histidine-containing phosphotransfer) domain-containing protein
LAISQRLSELMGGRMWVESQVNQGSTFYFTVQAEPAPAQARVYLRSEQPQLRDRRVLIVDDNTTNRRVLVNQTRSWNMIPRETASPHEALEWIKQGDPFDLALLDMQMPDMDGSTLAAEIRRYRPDPPIPIVLLSSLDRRDAGIEVAHFNAYLIKPIKQSVLYNTLMGIFAEQPIMVTPHDAERESVFDTRLAERLPLRILIAEDNTINQRLALQMLRRMGYRADIAGNGIEVLQALERQPYDMILMDIHMPEMDGFEATRLILEQWPQNRPRIVAVTANAMQGDREECLAAGMDDYISKPIQVRELQLVLERWGQSAPIPSESAVLQAAGTGVSVDWAVLEGLQELQEEGEPDFVQETIRMYLDDAPRMINAIRQAIQQKQPQDLRRAAHTLKGNSNSLGAMQIGRLSLELEKIGRGGTTEGAEPLLAELEQEFDRVRAALQART